MNQMRWIAAVLGLAGVGLFFAREPAGGQPEGQEAAVAALVQEIAEQQAAIRKNHEDLEAKLAALAEELRVARIFAARAGKPGGSE